MFAVLYRAYIDPTHEEKFQQAWVTVARYFEKYCGAIGSCLHRAEDGMWVAYSRWPNKQMRDAAWPGEISPSSKLPDNIRHAILTLQECMNHKDKIPEMYMEVVHDFL